MWAATPAEDLDDAEEGSGRAVADKKKAPARSRAPAAKDAEAQGYASLAQRRMEMPKSETTAFEPPRGVMPSAPRNVNALAAVAMEGGTTRYDIPFPVDIPDKSATMVLLLAKKVPGEANFLFAPDGGVPESSSHPFRVARFTNDTKGLLERGPIAVFANGALIVE